MIVLLGKMFFIQ